MNKERRAQIKKHIEGQSEDNRRAALGVFRKKYGEAHEDTQYVRTLVDGSPVPTNAELEADANAKDEGRRKKDEVPAPPPNQPSTKPNEKKSG